MGRKNRNRVSKYKSDIKVVEEEDDEENESTRLQKYHEYRIKVIWETYRAMIQYCDDMYIPLCDYLTVDMFEDFVDHLT
jgi:hypothetical protein